MIQELLGGNNVGIICDSRSKLSTTCGGGNLNITSPSPSPSPSPSSSAATATTNPNPTTPESLRCPRCDSANTKFCYYNNYNLTQPRHFCKTCRRYWTKGGALRNVPIGGGCRKNKTTTITSSAVKQNTAGKFKTISHEIAKSNLFSNFEQTELLSPNPMLWASQQNSHLLSLLRSNPNHNPNPNPNPNHMQNHVPVKEEGLMFGSSIPHLGLDHLGPFQAPSIGLSNSFYRNQGVLLGEVQSNGLQELYQRLRPTTSYAEHAPVILGHVASSTSTTTSAILDSAPVAAGDQFGFWNPTLSWSNDLSTTNGAYH